MSFFCPTTMAGETQLGMLDHHFVPATLEIGPETFNYGLIPSPIDVNMPVLQAIVDNKGNKSELPTQINKHIQSIIKQLPRYAFYVTDGHGSMANNDILQFNIGTVHEDSCKLPESLPIDTTLWRTAIFRVPWTDPNPITAECSWCGHQCTDYPVCKDNDELECKKAASGNMDEHSGNGAANSRAQEENLDDKWQYSFKMGKPVRPDTYLSRTPKEFHAEVPPRIERPDYRAEDIAYDMLIDEKMFTVYDYKVGNDYKCLFRGSTVVAFYGKPEELKTVIEPPETLKNHAQPNIKCNGGQKSPSQGETALGTCYDRERTIDADQYANVNRSNRAGNNLRFGDVETHWCIFTENYAGNVESIPMYAVMLAKLQHTMHSVILSNSLYVDQHEEVDGTETVRERPRMGVDEVDGYDSENNRVYFDAWAPDLKKPEDKRTHVSPLAAYDNAQSVSRDVVFSTSSDRNNYSCKDKNIGKNMSVAGCKCWKMEGSLCKRCFGTEENQHDELWKPARHNYLPFMFGRGGGMDDNPDHCSWCDIASGCDAFHVLRPTGSSYHLFDESYRTYVANYWDDDMYEKPVNEHYQLKVRYPRPGTDTSIENNIRLRHGGFATGSRLTNDHIDDPELNNFDEFNKYMLSSPIDQSWGMVMEGFERVHIMLEKYYEHKYKDINGRKPPAPEYYNRCMNIDTSGFNVGHVYNISDQWKAYSESFLTDREQGKRLDRGELAGVNLIRTKNHIVSNTGVNFITLADFGHVATSIPVPIRPGKYTPKQKQKTVGMVERPLTKYRNKATDMKPAAAANIAAITATDMKTGTAANTAANAVTDVKTATRSITVPKYNKPSLRQGTTQYVEPGQECPDIDEDPKKRRINKLAGKVLPLGEKAKWNSANWYWNRYEYSTCNQDQKSTCIEDYVGKHAYCQMCVAHINTLEITGTSPGKDICQTSPDEYVQKTMDAYICGVVNVGPYQVPNALNNLELCEMKDISDKCKLRDNSREFKGFRGCVPRYVDDFYVTYRGNTWPFECCDNDHGIYPGLCIRCDPEKGINHTTTPTSDATSTSTTSSIKATSTTPTGTSDGPPVWPWVVPGVAVTAAAVAGAVLFMIQSPPIVMAVQNAIGAHPLFERRVPEDMIQVEETLA